MFSFFHIYLRFTFACKFLIFFWSKSGIQIFKINVIQVDSVEVKT